MNNSKRKKIFTIISIGIIGLALILLNRISFAVDGNSTSTAEEEIPTEKIAESVVTHADGSLEITQFTSTGLADANGREFYCVNHGTRFHRADETLRIQTALKYGDMNGNKKKWPRTHDYCRDFEHDGEITYPYMHCIGRHHNLIDPNGEYHPDLAYILTYPTLGEWDELKQEAVWATDFARARGKDYGIGAEGQALYQEALRYEEFFDKTANAEGASTTDPKIDAKDETDVEDVRTLVDYESQTLTVGPLSIDYINGAYDGVAFGGISDMYFIGYNSEDEVVNERIDIEKYIYDGTEYDLEFFEPSMNDKSYVDYSEQVYPKGVSAGEEEFYLKIADPNEGVTEDDESVSKLVLHIDFQWMSASANICEMDAYVYKVTWDDKHSYHCCHSCSSEHCTHSCGGTCCYYCTAYSWLEAIDAQDHINVLEGKRQLYKTYLEIPTGDDKINITMKLGGYVWEDTPTGKETMADGVSNTTGENVDIRLKNVKVTLYDEDGNIVNLLTNENGEDIDNEEIYHRVNPTYTDENGEYLFVGLNPLRKYYVVFEYNGQRYLPTEYLNTGGGQYGSVEQMVNAGLYNTEEWEVTSKGTESDNGTLDGVDISRQEFDERFEEIASYPDNYPSSNSLGEVGNHNAVYTQLDLMGYTLDENGNYHQTETQLIDGFEYDERGLETDNYSEGEISSRVRDYIESNHEFPDEDAMKDIYSDIAGRDDETWRKLQFIEDCYIQAYTGSPFNQDIELYPVYDKFIINDDVGIAGASDYDTSTVTIGNTNYEPIYPGQLYINLGLWRRQEFDAAIRKDVYKATLKINDKTVVYNYDKRAAEEDGANNADGNDNNTYWDINVRMSDYEAYYNTGYNREIYETDYSYDSAALNHPGSDLEVYITYKITVRNQSMSIMSQIKEVVDYYDADYTYKPNLSWVIYQTDSNKRTSINKDQYYNMMEQDQDIIDNESTSAADFIDNVQDAKATEGKSRYGNEKDLGNQYQNLYIRGLENKKLATGESAYIYLTFEVNKEGGRIILDDDSSPKENIAEINGYTTFYRNGTELPNGVSKDSNDIAGLLDRDSNPGNLVEKDLQGNKYEKNFEDDTDRAPSLRVIIDNDAVRKANGTVWEDERNETVGDENSSTDSIIGDGIRQNDEIGISGVTVQLVEKCIDGSEYIWQETTTDSNGKYNFEKYIPGDYVIRFYYGDTVSTAIPSEGQSVSYNGQDFKSTTYQDGIEQSGQTDISGKYTAYTNTASQNESGTFGYDIYKSDSDSTNYSDAKDIWSTSNRANLNIIGPVNSAREVQGREDVIAYSDKDVTNHIAEVLASPYSGDSSLYDELMDNTYMTAETGVIVVEFEYDRQQTDGNKGTANNSENSSKNYIGDNQYNSNYSLNNIDLGLTERPKAQLEIDKSIANIKITLANNSILFDINEAANNALWQDHKEYSIDKNKIDADDDRVGNNDYYQEGDAIGMYREYYDDEDKHRYSYREEIDKIVRNTDKGLVQITMDEELMHGATIQVTYKIKVTNVGEVDYVDGNNKNFYYKGDTSGAHVSTTTTEQVIDYVQNNLQFEANNSTNSGDGWSVITNENLLSQDLVNARLTNNIAQFNTIIQTSSLNTDLAPGDEVTKTLILSQLITPENTEDDLQYTNMVEIAKTSNENGRRMAYSVVGNQDPLLDDASEVDSSTAERIVILTPFGENNFYYIIAGVVAVILVAGIILIKVKVLKKKEE